MQDRLQCRHWIGHWGGGEAVGKVMGLIQAMDLHHITGPDEFDTPDLIKCPVQMQDMDSLTHARQRHSSVTLKNPCKRDSTASLGSVFHCSTLPTVKNFF